jgi:acetoacetyl-[acyl-carrier protein] synthase
MLAQRYGDKFEDYCARREQTRSHSAAYAARADAAQLDVIYRFGEPLIDEAGLSISAEGVSVPGFAQQVIFEKGNPWQDMRETAAAE